jgi:hypothetical protein
VFRESLVAAEDPQASKAPHSPYFSSTASSQTISQGGYQPFLALIWGFFHPAMVMPPWKDLIFSPETELAAAERRQLPS